MRILIAEDDPVSRLVLTTNLGNWGHEVVTAVNGLEAWRASQEEDAPRLVILDWMMPEMEGPEVCRRIRELPATIPPYIILLTARQGTKEVVEGMQAGADDYLTKPYHRDELRVRVEVGVRMIELQQKLADQIGELREALDQVKRLQGIIPICGYCKKVRDDSDYWQNVESYIATHSEAEFSHGVCPSCFTQVVQPQLESFKANLPSPPKTNHP
jgi:sigma-B regulation protein RsbU (phosphoserine phosphatase)